VWRVDTQGYYAAVELQGAVEVIRIAAGRGQMLPARLRLEQRAVKRPGEQTRRFAVPVLDIEMTPGQLLTPAPEVVALKAAPDGTAHLTPVPADLPSRPAGNVAGQMRKGNEPRQLQQRRNSAQPLPPTGIQPRPAAQAQAESADPDDPGAEPGTITGPQMRKLHAMLTGIFGKDKERDQLLAICEDIVGRELTGPHQLPDGNQRTSKNLSLREAQLLIDKLAEAGSEDALYALVAASPEPAA
jgi:hypothetical protein